MKKKALILSVIIIALLLILFLVLFFKNKQNSSVPTNTIPTSDKILLPIGKDNVSVNNYYKEPSSVIIDEKDVVMEKNENYDILAYNYNNKRSFLISIKGGDSLEATRQLAESAFLQKLGITKEQACLLNVSMTLVIPGENFPAQDYGLSFCPNSKALPLLK